jgi:hypothetical protein
MAGGGMAHPPTAARLSDELEEDAASTLRSKRHAADELGRSQGRDQCVQTHASSACMAGMKDTDDIFDFFFKKCGPPVSDLDPARVGAIRRGFFGVPSARSGAPSRGFAKMGARNPADHSLRPFASMPENKSPLCHWTEWIV